MSVNVDSNKGPEYSSASKQIASLPLDNPASAFDEVNFNDGTIVANSDYTLYSSKIILSSKSTLDGKIDSTNQGVFGDCWLLSGVNSLSYSKLGKQILKDCLEYNDDGSVTVHMNGLGLNYQITSDELNFAKRTYAYSSGDDDMVVIELAMEKALVDVATKQVGINSLGQARHCVESTSQILNDESDVLDNSSCTELLYLLAGKIGSTVRVDGNINSILDEFRLSGKDNLAYTTNFKIEKTIQDKNGEYVSLKTEHAYAIKNVDNNYVTLVDPEDSSKTIQIKKNEYMETAQNITTCDLTKNVNLAFEVSKEPYYDKNGNTCFEFDCSSCDYNNGFVQYAKQIDYYNNSGDLIKIRYTGEDGNIAQESFVNSKMNYTKITYYNDKNYKFKEIDFDGEGNKIGVSYFDKNGTVIKQE